MLHKDSIMDNKKKSIEQLAREFEDKWNAVRLPEMAAEDLLDLMDYYARAGMDFEAELCRRISERVAPHHPEVMLTRAHWYADEGDWMSAERTRKSVPETSNYENLLFAIESNVRSTNIQEAWRILDENIPDVMELPDLDFLFDCAVLFRDYGYSYDASRCLSRIPRTYIDHRQADELQAECSAFQCDYAGAKSILNRLLDESPFDQNLWTQLATCCFRLNEAVESADACEYALAIGPNVDAARIKALNAMKEEHEDILRQAIAQQDYIACMEGGNIAYERGEYAEAYQYYSYAGLFCPRGHRDREKIVFRIACCHIRNGQWQEGIQQLLSLYPLGGGLWGFYYECAQLLLEQGADRQAVQVLMLTIRNGEMSVGRYESAATLLIHHGCFEPARDIWRHIASRISLLDDSYRPKVREVCGILGLREYL